MTNKHGHNDKYDNKYSPNQNGSGSGYLNAVNSTTSNSAYGRGSDAEIDRNRKLKAEAARLFVDAKDPDCDKKVNELMKTREFHHVVPFHNLNCEPGGVNITSYPHNKNVLYFGAKGTPYRGIMMRQIENPMNGLFLTKSKHREFTDNSNMNPPVVNAVMKLQKNGDIAFYDFKGKNPIVVKQSDMKYSNGDNIYSPEILRMMQISNMLAIEEIAHIPGYKEDVNLDVIHKIYGGNKLLQSKQIAGKSAGISL